MIHAIWTAATGMQAQQMRIDTIANNLANVNTTGYKKSSVDFQDLVYQTISQPTSTGNGGDNAGFQVGRGVRPVASTKFYSQGSLQVTNNPLHLAIDNSASGNGLANDFFQVLDQSNQPAFTRDGAFKLDSNGFLVTSQGFRLNPPISIPKNALDIHINENGAVVVRVAGSPEPIEAGQIQIARFANPAGLAAVGNNLVKATPVSGQAELGVAGIEGRGLIRQGMLETSNVDIVTEMVTMIATQKAYDTSSKGISTADKMMDTANQLVR